MQDKWYVKNELYGMLDPRFESHHVPYICVKYEDQNGSPAVLAAKTSAGVLSEVNYQR